jgi:hypothetical protein
MGWTGVPFHTKSLSLIRKKLEEETGVKIFKHGLGLSYGVYNKAPYQNLLVVILWRNSRNELSWKDMDESIGPYYYDIPMKWLNAPTAGFKPNEKYRNTCKLKALQEKMKKELVKNMKEGDTFIYDTERKGVYLKPSSRKNHILFKGEDSSVTWSLPLKRIHNINGQIPQTLEEYKLIKIEKLLQ